MLIDSHTHLDVDVFAEDREAVLERARTAGVTRLITIGAGGGGIASAHAAVGLAEQEQGVFASVGIHPHDAASEYSLEVLEELARHPKVVAIGETGLDFFRDWCPAENQYRAFEQQIELALQVGKPLIIHARAAARECLELLKRYGAQKVGGVFHCYSEDVNFALELADLNFLVSFPGSLTFKKADALREVARQIPLEQIMVETDAPYMAPEPYRGQRCESAYVVEVARVLSSLKGISYELCCEQLTKNTEKLFRIPAVE